MSRRALVLRGALILRRRPRRLRQGRPAGAARPAVRRRAQHHQATPTTPSASRTRRGPSTPSTRATAPPTRPRRAPCRSPAPPPAPAASPRRARCPTPTPTRADEPLRAPGGRARMRRRAPRPHRRGGRARRSMSIPPPRWSGTTRVLRDALVGRGPGRPADRLCGEGQLQRRGAARRWPTWARAPTRSPRARSAARWPPASRPSASSSPASARPTARSPSPSRPASPRSTSSPSPSCTWSTASPRRLGKRAAVAIRVNPDVEAGGHAKISTGKAENKFGVSLRRGRAALRQRLQHGRRPARRRRLPHRQPDHRPGAHGGRLRARCAAWSSGCAARA